jgi:CheY-like chemotaxis protein
VDRLVLIADGNTGNGRRLADACTSAGILCRLAGQGAEALEMALAEPPHVVVAQLDLPLVDGLKLAEILRANPRTRAARFLFLGGDGQAPRPGGVGDVLLPSSQRPEEIVPTVEELIAKRDRIESLDAATEPGQAQGDLSQLPLVELLQLFHLNRKSGSLELVGPGENPGEEQGQVLIRDGEVTQALVGTVEGEKALFRLLAWSQGRFVFEEGRFDTPPRILHPTRALLQEGLRQLDERNRLSPQLPPLDSQAKLCVKSAELPNIVHPLTQEVLLLLELYPRVRDVVNQCSFPDYQVLRTLHTLAARGIIKLSRTAAPRIGPTTETIGLFDEAQCRRLRSWLRDASAPEGKPAQGKLLVASSDPSATPDFINLLRQVPGVELDPALASKELGAGSLASMGRIVLEGGFGIELIHVPVQRSSAPLWPLAGHGALGTLFLLSGRVGEAAERVSAMSEAIQSLPRARIFHVVMLGKGERISPDELRENLSLIDEASLFLLPLESSKQPAALLRGLFSRIVP